MCLGSSRIQGKGVNLPDPTLGDLPLPVTAQLVNGETSACFEAVYDNAEVTKNDSGQFKAKAPWLDGRHQLATAKEGGVE
jgi:hypothetical protein